MLTTDDTRLRAQLAPTLPAGLLAHIDRVVALAAAFATRHGADVARTRLAAQGHDVLRAVPAPELLRRAAAAGLAVIAEERAEPVLLHGPLGAIVLREQYGVTDADVLHAVWWHTTGHPEYGAEAWAMFVADKVDPHKVARWPALAEVHALAEAPDDDALTRAALRYLELQAARAAAEGWRLHPMAVETAAALRGRLHTTA